MAMVTGIEIEKLENLIKVMKDLENLSEDTDISSVSVQIDRRLNATITKNLEGKWTTSLNISEGSGNYMDR